ncbi:RNA-directed DNA polymerase, eukaryota, Reverse transcriptase zinc-binding domain protein [Artemisia annua]|uniref:RNA-directed DNA polymerase, eukaryota, Reverse transcriptase zinc-binding domain protein n=1 Tax=Artemisia annua TaxID=35608 RepID=A0A2U1NZA7_ARTAN|nr:RNA-directed DNA polymerase, eukaryota, Reverse transcriptase zinc-binding domain protein [Artemisia annua]
MAKLDDVSNSWAQIISSIVNRPAQNSIWSVIQRLVLGASVYFVWQERNLRLFGVHSRTVEELIKIVIDNVRLRLMGLKLKTTPDVIMAAEVWKFPIDKYYNPLSGSYDRRSWISTGYWKCNRVFKIANSENSHLLSRWELHMGMFQPALIEFLVVSDVFRCVPRHSFILWMDVNGILKTQDRISRWLNIQDMSCPFCKRCKDSHSHLFFICNFARRLWERLKIMAKLDDVSNSWAQIISSIVNRPAQNSIWSVIQRLVLGASVYFVWQERNLRLFGVHSRTVEELIKIVIDNVRLRLMGLKLKTTPDVIMAAEVWKFPIDKYYNPLSGSYDRRSWISTGYWKCNRVFKIANRYARSRGCMISLIWRYERCRVTAGIRLRDYHGFFNETE